MTGKERITEQATEMFLKEGIKSIRMDDIASALGVSKRTIYELFENKENLISECAQYFFLRQNKLHESLTRNTNNLIEKLMTIVDMAEEYMETDIRFMSSIQKFYPSIYETIIKQHLTEQFMLLKGKMQEAINEGLLVKNFNLDFALTMFAESLFNAFSKPNVLISTNISQIEAFRYLTIYFFRGLATPKGIGLIDSYIQVHKVKQKEDK